MAAPHRAIGPLDS